MQQLCLRVLSLLFAALLLCSLCACLDGGDEPLSPLSEQTALSLSVLTDQLGLDDASAMDVLVQLRRAGFAEAVRMAFVEGGKDEDGSQTFRLWLESTAVDVVLDADGLVSRLESGGEVFYVQELSNTLPLIPPADDTPDDGGMTDTPPSSGPSDGDSDDPTPPQPSTPPDGGDAVEKTLTIVSLTTPLEAGKKATLVARGKAGEKYDISVRYASGESTAQGLEPQVADEEGLLQWTFRVASRVVAGEYPVTVSGGGETITVTLVVE